MKANLTALIIILSCGWISWEILSSVTEPKVIKEPPCRTEWGVPKSNEWCKERNQAQGRDRSRHEQEATRERSILRPVSIL